MQGRAKKKQGGRAKVQNKITGRAEKCKVVGHKLKKCQMFGQKFARWPSKKMRALFVLGTNKGIAALQIFGPCSFFFAY
jgi:hypothetical protein